MSKPKDWISLDRAVFDHWIQPTKPFSKFEAWVNLIAMANHAPAKVMLKGQIVTLKRGQQARSMVTLASDWGWSREKVKRFCNTLISDDMILLETSHLTSVITICNYNEKQTNTTADKAANESANGHQAGSKRSTNNNDNNENNENKNTSPEPDKPILMQFNCTKDDVFNVHQEDIDLWAGAYPAVDIKLDLNQMQVWLISNPIKIKTKRGMPKFITNWLSRTQNKGGNRGTANISISGQQVDNSAYGKVVGSIKQSNNPEVVGDDGIDVRPQVDQQLRSGSGSPGSVGSDIEGDFTRTD